MANSAEKSQLPDNWSQLRPEEKRKYRLDNFLKTDGIRFVSPEAENRYKKIARRMVDVMNVEEPDRVPVTLPVGNLPLEMKGYTMYTAMYEPERAIEAVREFNDRYMDELEYFANIGSGMGEALEILDYKIYAWPGHGIPKSASGWQYIEGEYMTVDEYDDLIRDPSDFWLRKYLPRVFGAFEGFRMFQPFTNINENVHLGQLGVLAAPQVQNMLQKLMDAGKAFQKGREMAGQYAGQGVANGFPVMGSHFCKAPFDILGDTLRGTQGIMKDMFRCPDKLLKALDVVADVMIGIILNSPNIHRMCMVGYPLHKGADGWMSQKQFDTFYWPSLKKVMDAFIAEGLIQRLFAEGGYNTRLEYVNVFPRGMVTWHFDQTNMKNAKEILGKECCIQGNIPTSLMITGTPEEVKVFCRNLIETCGEGGGYILTAGGVGSGGAKIENLKAMFEAANEYGVYRK
jgi:hypothetical protein